MATRFTVAITHRFRIAADDKLNHATKTTAFVGFFVVHHHDLSSSRLPDEKG
jgi:hypothetical protein